MLPRASLLRSHLHQYQEPNFCTRNDIRLSGKRLGRPPKNAEISAAQKQQLSADQRRRNEVEGCFGSGKRKYSLDLIMARLSKGAENSISMAFVVMCAEKIRRLLRLFLSLFCLVMQLEMARLSLDGTQEHLAA
ncbi:transposase [Cyanobium sp. To12R1]|nr:transposase [Cyanobium sp. To12R1]